MRTCHQCSLIPKTFPSVRKVQDPDYSRIPAMLSLR